MLECSISVAAAEADAMEEGEGEEEVNEPLNYATPIEDKEPASKRDARGAGLCLIAGGLLAVAGAIGFGLGEIASAIGRGSRNDGELIAFFTLLVAGVLLVAGFVRWLRGA
jgi:hypothetical protein